MNGAGETFDQHRENIGLEVGIVVFGVAALTWLMLFPEERDAFGKMIVSIYSGIYFVSYM